MDSIAAHRITILAAYKTINIGWTTLAQTHISLQQIKEKIVKTLTPIYR